MRCMVPGCDVDSSCTSTSKGATFHRLPTERRCSEKWLTSLEIESWEPTQHNVVCSEHFQKHDLYMSSNGQWRVRAGAIPAVSVQNTLKNDDFITPSDIKICRICFATDCNLYLMTEYKKLNQAYEILTGLTVENNDNLPLYLCTECSHRLMGCIRFRTKSIQANLILQEIIQKHDHLSIEAIKSCEEYQHFRSKLGITHKHNNHYDLEIEHVRTESIDPIEQGRTDDISSLYDSNVIKVEKDETLNQDSLEDQDSMYDTMRPLRLHEVTVPRIKLEKDDLDSQDGSNNAYITNNCKDVLPTLHNSVGIKVKVETIETSNEDLRVELRERLVENDNGDIANGDTPIGEDYASDDGLSLGEQEMGGEDYPSESVFLEELQKRVNYRNQSRLKFNAGSSSYSGTHSGKQIYSCDICKKAFSQKYNLVPHLRIHSGIKPYSCDVCNMGFTLKYNLVSHLRKHSGEKPYECNICKKTFILRNVLQAHLRTHTGEKPYACKLCDKVFSQRANLSAHIRIHSGERPYSCNICKKQFRQSCNLVTHSRTHSGEKPYSCHVCMISFSRNYHLKTHLKIHSGEKPYSCDVCKKAFNTQSNLQKHITIHTGVKPYSCYLCNKAFNRKCNLNTHIKTHSNEKPYPCVVCNKAFRRKDQLKIHYKVHSDQKPFDVNVND